MNLAYANINYKPASTINLANNADTLNINAVLKIADGKELRFYSSDTNMQL